MINDCSTAHFTRPNMQCVLASFAINLAYQNVSKLQIWVRLNFQ